MNELTIANQRILSHTISEDSLLAHKLRVDGYELFDYYYEKSSEANHFKTPTNFENPEEGPGYQYVPRSKEIIEEVKTYTTNLINNYLDKSFYVGDIWYLHQTNDTWINNPKHTHMTAHWVCVLYLDVKENDTIEFYDGDTMEEYNPSFGEIIFFPGNTYHKPGPNQGNKRLTLNLEFVINYTEEEQETLNTWLQENQEALIGLTVDEIHNEVFG